MKTIVINVPDEVKGAWVSESRATGMKLQDWIVKMVGAMDYDYSGFTLSVPSFEPFERYVRALSDDDARSLFTRMRELDSRQPDAVSSIKIVRSYLEKRVCIADGIADRDLFLDINADALSYYSAAPSLTHLDLVNAVSSAS
ncbi:hypothetical protein LH427_09365 [Laribacter hongkongensis]|uniref:hypothetical protein n=1 Tax=Laribacter hongkongensis TaxID=168471 RepID=UPI001EFC6A11|nr:hypothetical protein [Laribacter hongkongensis]MCG8991925.1 hypothetical protein [Laribacter hongkongensis]MCG8997344.1 hypothetical protein [Laribacter hongkongensis]MCG9000794.1 hypothetical protein [Laribacter hongkongensis]MCG9005448.1 hypothetical protein [Laribacter hongkongensis]MCG9007064.1 hypothetical protein [Laribacter hongkongensis]